MEKQGLLYLQRGGPMVIGMKIIILQLGWEVQFLFSIHNKQNKRDPFRNAKKIKYKKKKLLSVQRSLYLSHLVFVSILKQGQVLIYACMIVILHVLYLLLLCIYCSIIFLDCWRFLKYLHAHFYPHRTCLFGLKKKYRVV